MTGAAAIFATGFFDNSAVHTALIVGGIVAVVSAIVGTFTVMRGQSFAGHSLSDIGTAGGSAAFLVSVPSLYGFVAFNLAAAAIMDLIGVRRPRGRDLATGIVLGASLGLAALFLYEDTTTSSTTGATVDVLFGSIFSFESSLIPVVVALGVVAVGLVVVLYRPLLLSSVSTDLAAARGVPVRRVAVGYLLALAVGVSLSSITIGAILSTALLIGPPATALRLAKRPGVAMALAGVIGVATVWLGILLAYDSASWTSNGEGWPVSFFIVAVVFVVYVLAQLLGRLRPEHRAGSIHSGA
jgi:zinc/manganese transport system permease protein